LIFWVFQSTFDKRDERQGSDEGQGGWGGKMVDILAGLKKYKFNIFKSKTNKNNLNCLEL
jgi:hypothetical protein